ncbi:MAG: ferritin family protein [Thermoplasmata archaeon]
MEMSYFNKIDTDEIIAMAAYSEDESYKFYLALADQVNNDFLKEKLRYFADQEKFHKKILIDLNENLFGKKEVKEPSKKYPFECFIQNANIHNINSLLETIEIAMNCEKRAETIYKIISTRLKDKYAKKIFLYLSNMEKQHYIALKGDYDFFNKFAGSIDELNKKSSFIGIKFKK